MSLEKRLNEIEQQFPETPLRWFIKDQGEYQCLKTGRTSDSLDDLRSGNQKSMVFDIVNPERDDDSG